MSAAPEKLARRLERQVQITLAQHEVTLDLIAKLHEAAGTGPLGEFPSPYCPVEHRPGTDPEAGTMVAFSSLGTGAGIVPAEFRAALMKSPAEAYFVKDFSRLWYQRGLHPHASTRQEATALLAGILKDAPRPWLFVGASAGAFAALWFGASLGADRIAAFSPQTQITRTVFRRFLGWPPAETGFDFSDPGNDLATHLAATPLAGSADVHYSARSKVDAAQAKRIEGLPGITLVPHDLKTHHVSTHLHARGTLLEAIHG